MFKLNTYNTFNEIQEKTDDISDFLDKTVGKVGMSDLDEVILEKLQAATSTIPSTSIEVFNAVAKIHDKVRYPNTLSKNVVNTLLETSLSNEKLFLYYMNTFRYLTEINPLRILIAVLFIRKNVKDYILLTENNTVFSNVKNHHNKNKLHYSTYILLPKIYVSIIKVLTLKDSRSSAFLKMFYNKPHTEHTIRDVCNEYDLANLDPLQGLCLRIDLVMDSKTLPENTKYMLSSFGSLYNIFGLLATSYVSSLRSDLYWRNYYRLPHEDTLDNILWTLQDIYALEPKEYNTDPQNYTQYCRPVVCDTIPSIIQQLIDSAGKISPEDAWLMPFLDAQSAESIVTFPVNARVDTELILDRDLSEEAHSLLALYNTQQNRYVSNLLSFILKENALYEANYYINHPMRVIDVLCEHAVLTNRTKSHSREYYGNLLKDASNKETLADYRGIYVKSVENAFKIWTRLMQKPR